MAPGTAKRWLLLLCLVGVAGGCGRTATVTGKVTYKERPVVYGSVVLQNEDMTAVSGVIEPDGSYTVENVPAGLVKIAVLSRDPTKGRGGDKGARGKKTGDKKLAVKPPADWFPLPPHYEDPQTSGLQLHVGTGRVEHLIELK